MSDQNILCALPDWTSERNSLAETASGWHPRETINLVDDDISDDGESTTPDSEAPSTIRLLPYSEAIRSLSRDEQMHPDPIAHHYRIYFNRMVPQTQPDDPERSAEVVRLMNGLAVTLSTLTWVDFQLSLQGALFEEWTNGYGEYRANLWSQAARNGYTSRVGGFVRTFRERPPVIEHRVVDWENEAEPVIPEGYIGIPTAEVIDDVLEPWVPFGRDGGGEIVDVPQPNLPFVSALFPSSGLAPPVDHIVTQEEVDNDVCGICHDPYVVGSTATKLPCVGNAHHFFHTECIEEWFEYNHEQQCPFRCAQQQREQ